MIPHNKPTLGPEEEQAALRVIRSGWLAQGAEVSAFENEFCAFLGLSEGHAVAVTSGTSALFLALWALKGEGKKVAIPVYACSSLRHAVAMAGGIEVLIDSGPESPAEDIVALNCCEAETAIFPHLFGLPADLSQLKGIDIIEDCAQALGALVNGNAVGLQGRIGVYSFSATKLMTSGGQGGMLVSREKTLIEAIRDYRSFDCRRDYEKRFNFQMTDLQAAIGREQLRKLPGFLARRAEIFSNYKRAGLRLLDIGQKHKSFLSPVRYRAAIQTDFPATVIGRLASAGVRAIVPVEDWELLGEQDRFPHAWKWTKGTVSLPIYPSLTDAEVETVLAGMAVL